MIQTGVINHKCKNCNAPLKFNPQGQNWKCEYCRSEFTKAELDEYEASVGKEELDKNSKKIKMEKNAKGMDLYTCPSCGAEIIADENTSATFCVYCRNTAILRNRLVEEFNPSKVIPFKLVKNDAIEAFKKFNKGKPLAPKEFTSPQIIDDIRGIYIPFWLYDYKIDGEIEATGTKSTTWTSGDYIYTKVDTYDVFRSGNMAFNKIPVDGSKKFQDDIMNSIEPFDYSGLVDFDYSYLSGFYAEKYDVDSTSANQFALTRASTTATSILRRNISGYSTVSVKRENHNPTETKYDYVLLPVWILNIKYNDKIYPFAMNGQTGKMIGDVPVDKKKAWIITIILFVCIFGVASLIWVIGGKL